MNIPKRLRADARPSWFPVLAVTQPGEILNPEGTKAILVCPRGHTAALVTHSIAADGTVSPSAVCPVEGCGFHESIRLLDWGT